MGWLRGGGALVAPVSPRSPQRGLSVWTALPSEDNTTGAGGIWSSGSGLEPPRCFPQTSGLGPGMPGHPWEERGGERVGGPAAWHPSRDMPPHSPCIPSDEEPAAWGTQGVRPPGDPVETWRVQLIKALRFSPWILNLGLKSQTASGTHRCYKC